VSRFEAGLRAKQSKNEFTSLWRSPHSDLRAPTTDLRPTGSYWDGTAASELQASRRPRSASAAIFVCFGGQKPHAYKTQVLAQFKLSASVKTPGARAASSNAPMLEFKGASGLDLENRQKAPRERPRPQGPAAYAAPFFSTALLRVSRGSWLAAGSWLLLLLLLLLLPPGTDTDTDTGHRPPATGHRPAGLPSSQVCQCQVHYVLRENPRTSQLPTGNWQLLATGAAIRHILYSIFDIPVLRATATATAHCTVPCTVYRLWGFGLWAWMRGWCSFRYFSL
jgi:hypothetical protein